MSRLAEEGGLFLAAGPSPSAFDFGGRWMLPSALVARLSLHDVGDLLCRLGLHSGHHVRVLLERERR